MKIPLLTENERAYNKVFAKIEVLGYEIKEYSIKDIVSEGIKYNLDKNVTFDKTGDKSYLINGKNKVLIPVKFLKLIEYIFNKKSVTYKSLSNAFKDISPDVINECIENLKKMKVLH